MRVLRTRKKSGLFHVVFVVILTALLCIMTSVLSEQALAAQETNSDSRDDYSKTTEYEDEESVEIQREIDALMSTDEFDECPNAQKEETKTQLNELLQQYLQLTPIQRGGIDASRLFSLNLYTRTMAYYPSEVPILNHYTEDDIDYHSISQKDRDDLQSGIDRLPALHEITDVSAVTGVMEPTQKWNIPTICYTDQDVVTYVPPEEIDDIYQRVLRMAEQLYQLPKDERLMIDSMRLELWIHYFTCGLDAYSDPDFQQPKPYVKSRKLLSSQNAVKANNTTYTGKVVDSSFHTYNGSLNKYGTPRCGYYKVKSEIMGGKTVEAFCGHASGTAPAVGTTMAEYVASTDASRMVYAILYYGYGGPLGGTDRSWEYYIETHFAIDYAWNKGSAHAEFAKAAYDKIVGNLTTAQIDFAVKHSTVYWGNTNGAKTQYLVWAKFDTVPEYEPVNTSVTQKEWHHPESKVTATALATAQRTDDASMTIVVKKTDSFTGEPVAGAEFMISRDGVFYDDATFKTDETGIATYVWKWRDVRTKSYSAMRDYVINYDTLPAKLKAEVDGQQDLWTSYQNAYNDAKEEAEAEADAEWDEIMSEEHVWTVTEVGVPNGYATDLISMDKTAALKDQEIVFDITNEQNTTLSVKKVSSKPFLTMDKSTYSLAGAVYGVYVSYDDAMQDKNRFETLITDEDGMSEKAEIRQGTYYIRELEASEGFDLCSGEDDADENGIHTIVIDSYGDHEFECREPIQAKGSIHIKKISGDGTATPLEGVSFVLSSDDRQTELTGITDKNGEIVWEDLLPQTYTLKEVSTVNGASLLIEPIQIEIPMTMTEEEAMSEKVDLKQAYYNEKEHMYYFYNITCTIANDTVYQLPFTGTDNNRMIIVMPISLGLIFVGLLMLRRKKIV